MLSHLSREVSRKTTSTNVAVKKVSRNNAKTQEQKLDRSTSCLKAIEDPGTFLFDPPTVEVAIRKNLKSSTDSQVSRRYLGGVNIA